MLTPNNRRVLQELRRRFTGVAIGIVTQTQDPENLGRVRVRFPWIHEREGQDVSAWARVTRPIAGPGYGLWAQPRLNEEVLVAFEFGDLERPVVVGRLWNGQDRPPDTELERRVEKTKSGWIFNEADERPGQEKVRHFAAGVWEWLTDIAGRLFRWTDGKTTVAVNEQSGDVTITTSGKVTVMVGGGNRLVMDPAAGTVEIDAASQIIFAGGGPPVARVGDSVVGTCTLGGTVTAQIVSGSSNVQSG